MEFFNAVGKRIAVRSFLGKEVEPAKLKKILEAANLAPSAGNLQSYSIVIVQNKKHKETIVHFTHEQEFIAQAPVVLVFLADRKKSAAKYGKRGAELYCVQDATIAAAYAQLAAAALGLGSVWIGKIDENKISRLVKAKKHQVPIAIIPIGYPAEEMQGHERRKLESMARKI